MFMPMQGNIAVTKGSNLGAKFRHYFVKKVPPADISSAQNLAREGSLKNTKGIEEVRNYNPGVPRRWRLCFISSNASASTAS